MVPRTRRHLLQIATAVTVSLAGCSGLIGEESSTSRSVSEADGTMISGENSETDPETVLLRANEPPIRPGKSSESSTDPDRRERRSLRGSHVIVGEGSQARQLVVADSVDTDPIDSFLSATDFDSETLYLETNSVEECFRLRLCGIAWAADEVRTAYVRQVRPYDERCSADRDVFESRLIRVPEALSSDDVNSYSSSIGRSGRCRDKNATDAERTDGSEESVTTAAEYLEWGAK